MILPSSFVGRPCCWDLSGRGLSQWETALQCYVVSHWLSAYLYFFISKFLVSAQNFICWNFTIILQISSFSSKSMVSTWIVSYLLVYTWHTPLHYPHAANAGCVLAGVAPVAVPTYSTSYIHNHVKTPPIVMINKLISTSLPICVIVIIIIIIIAIVIIAIIVSLIITQLMKYS